MTKKRKTLENNKAEMGAKDDKIVEISESNLELMISQLRKEIEGLSYEDSLKDLENILIDLQDDNVILDELHIRFMQAQIHLEHCEKLLQKVEQEVLFLDPKTLELTSEKNT